MASLASEDNPEKILIIKHGALGDIIQGIDAYAAIRNGHPDANITLLTTAPFAGLTRMMPFFDHVVVDKRGKPWDVVALFSINALMKSGWSRIYDLQSSKRTRRYFKSLVPKHVEFVGIHDGVSHPIPDMTGVNNRDRMVRTAEIGGCKEVDAPMDWLDSARPESAPKGKYAVLIPGCSPVKPEKRWQGSGFSGLADGLLAQGITPVLAGTNLDRGAGDDVLAHSREPHQMVDLIGTTSLTELAGLLKDAQVVVGNDTGPVFMAARLGAPTVMVMSRHTDPEMSAPFGPRADWVKRDDLNDLSAKDVLEKVNRLI